MRPIYIALFVIVLTACGQDTLEDKKLRLNKLKAEYSELDKQIASLENDILKSDPNYNQLARQQTLISVLEVQPRLFEHMFEVRASVASRRNVLISAETSGRIVSIQVREGDEVRKGQLLITLDASVLENSVEELKTSLDLATTVYEKRARLWKQNIGSELQYLEAKNQMETLQRKLATAESQLRQARVRAPFNGVVDDIEAKLGEMAMFGSPMIRILSVDAMHLEADVSEKYLGRLKKGDSVHLNFPAFEHEITSVISSVGQVINQLNRTFSVEIALPSGAIPYKPNLVAIVKMRDYYREDALVIPSELIQQDNLGNFVYVIDSVDSELKAKKQHISTGKSFQSNTEILDGIRAGSRLIRSGHREVTDGALVKVATRESI
jgi:RND family efflux transporter MFP subunit